MSEIKISFDENILVLKKAATKKIIVTTFLIFCIAITGTLLSNELSIAIPFYSLLLLVGIVYFTKKDIIEINTQNSTIKKHTVILFIEFKYDYMHKIKGPLEIYSKEIGDESTYISFFILIKNKEVSLFNCHSIESVKAVKNYFIDNEITVNSHRINFIKKRAIKNSGLMN